ncbi:hypothetical protein Syun_020882 [Stephania yunnanensis]|uniref:Uncharacterized protein n=1 Tax=Stephania yunnanensis TaxID=152371 RepID=A0AAP0NQF6_9MAGN
MESQAETLNQLTSDDLEGKFALLESSSVDDDLASLKKELSGNLKIQCDFKCDIHHIPVVILARLSHSPLPVRPHRLTASLVSAVGVSPSPAIASACIVTPLQSPALAFAFQPRRASANVSRTPFFAAAQLTASRASPMLAGDCGHFASPPQLLRPRVFWIKLDYMSSIMF